MAAQQKGGQLPASMLSQLLKSCLSLEVDASPVAARLHPLLATQRWSERVLAALQPQHPSMCLTGVTLGSACPLVRGFVFTLLHATRCTMLSGRACACAPTQLFTEDTLPFHPPLAPTAGSNCEEQ